MLVGNGSHGLSSSHGNELPFLSKFVHNRTSFGKATVLGDVIFILVTDDILTVWIKGGLIQSFWHFKCISLVLQAEASAAEDLHGQVECNSESNENEMLPKEHV